MGQLGGRFCLSKGELQWGNIWLFQKNKPTEGLWTYFFENPLEFFIYPWKFQRNQSSTPPGNCTKLEIPCLGNIQEIPRPKQKPGPLEISHFFLVTLGNATCYLIPLEIPYPQPPPHVCFFFLNIPLNSHTLNSQIKH